MPEAFCPRCGYALEPQAACATCGGPATAFAPRPPVRGLGPSLAVAVAALPRGLGLLLRTPRTKRWLVPPFLLTSAAIVGLYLWAVRGIRRLAERVRPDEVELPAWGWIEDLSERWSWVRSAWGGVVAALEWLFEWGLAFLLGQPAQLLTAFLVGSLAVWYGASIVYEALAGPFLDEIQARVEARWFGEDPRAARERPRGLSSERAIRLFALGAFVAGAAGLGLHLVLGWSLLASLAALPLAILVPLLFDRGFGPWLAWFTRVEAGAAWAGVQGALLSFTILALALPLYFLPVVGYFLFALATGVATATSLLDIPLERRGWSLRARLRLLRRYAPAWIAFGVLAGLLLAVPLVGALLFVPTTSLGGLWMLVRLDKSGLHGASPPPDLAPAEPAP